MKNKTNHPQHRRQPHTKSIIQIAILLCILTSTALAANTTTSLWHGFDSLDFVVDGQNCILVSPKTTAPGSPWIWRARFFAHQPQTDIALLNKGFHLAYMDVANLFGSPKAVAHWDAFYKYLTTEKSLAKKVALEGMSRGGLIIYNWAAKNPEKVACIYGDAPVCDFKSWPGGKGKPSASDWQKCLDVYGLTEKQALTYAHNPIDNLAPLAKHNVPLLNICGADDNAVPMAENTNILATRYKQLGGNIIVLDKPGIAHHPHSFKDPSLIVNFVLKHCGQPVEYFNLRCNLNNSLIKFQREKKGRVAFLGGSITNMQGWRIMVGESLQKRFPSTQFEFINAGIPSTDSTLGAFRLGSTAFHNGPVDLLFVEYAVNDLHNNRGENDRIRGMEGVIRQARLSNPNIDIIMMHFIDPRYMPMYNTGQTPPVIVSHEKVAEHYQVPSINLALEVTERINNGEFTWREDFKNLHPSQFGHHIYTDSINRLLDAAWKKPVTKTDKVTNHPIPENPLDPLSYYGGRYVDITAAKLKNGWKIAPSWNATDTGTRKRFINIPMLVAKEPCAILELKFTGTAIGLCQVAGPDVGIIEYSIDGGRFKNLDQFTQWSKGLHIPWAYVLDDNLTNTPHKLVLRTTDKKNKDSKGFASRIVKFLVNSQTN